MSNGKVSQVPQRQAPSPALVRLEPASPPAKPPPGAGWNGVRKCWVDADGNKLAQQFPPPEPFDGPVRTVAGDMRIGIGHVDIAPKVRL